MRIIKIDFDPLKAASNLRKHGVSFDEAASCLLDAQALVQEDQAADGEQRIVLLGRSVQSRLLLVVYTLRDELPRIISARKATRKEMASYEKAV
jgi:uncharacterized protein